MKTGALRDGKKRGRRSVGTPRSIATYNTQLGCGKRVWVGASCTYDTGEARYTSHNALGGVVAGANWRLRHQFA